MRESEFESFLSRGDRRLCAVIERAWQSGCKFDAWQDHFRDDLWQRAFDAVGLDPWFYTHRERETDEVFPWDHIDVAVHKKFLLEDYLMSIKGETRVDCRDKCFACGILPKFSETRSHTAPEAWECPPVKPKNQRSQRVPNVTLI